MRNTLTKKGTISNTLTIIVFALVLLGGAWYHNIEGGDKTTNNIESQEQQNISSNTISKKDESYRVPKVSFSVIEIASKNPVVENLEMDNVKQPYESLDSEKQEEISAEKDSSSEKENIDSEREFVTEPYLIDCSAYCETGNPCKDGTYPKVGETVAGKKEWLGRSCNLYYCTKDGEIGDLIGTYIFHDTGFGDDADGDGIGSIEAGTKIDLYLGDYDTCIKWGVPKVYIEFLD